MAASVVSALRRADEIVLIPRILSALVMAPPVLAAAWWGGWAFAVLAALVAAIMCWEWHGMVDKGFPWSGRAAALLCALASLGALETPVLACAVVFAAAAVSAATTPTGEGRSKVWAAAGALYAGLPCVALVWLRHDAESGLITIFWLLLLIWATDSGAYAAGRGIGGPLLAPRVSPKKTWAGLLGGMAAAAATSWAVAWLADLTQPALLAAAGAVLAVIAQIGDLAESWVKRRWNVKDSSNIIPGHGGVLDRVDGLLAAASVLALTMAATGWSPLDLR